MRIRSREPRKYQYCRSQILRSISTTFLRIKLLPKEAKTSTTCSLSTENHFVISSEFWSVADVSRCLNNGSAGSWRSCLGDLVSTRTADLKYPCLIRESNCCRWKLYRSTFCLHNIYLPYLVLSIELYVFLTRYSTRSDSNSRRVRYGTETKIHASAEASKSDNVVLLKDACGYFVPLR